MPKSHVVKLRSFWVSGIAVALACVIATLSPRWLATDRLTNLDLSNNGMPYTYLMYSKSSPGRCHVLGRREATMRRDDAGQKGKPWRYVRFGNDGRDEKLPSWLVRSKAKGTLFLIPVEDVGDWAFPFLYGFVAEQREDLNLPTVSWTQLFLNRAYGGLYLRMKLPYDKRKKDGGSGVLREILTVDNDALTKVDTRFNEAGLLYVSTVVDGRFSSLAPPPRSLAWLAKRCPTTETTLLMDNKPPFKVSLLPLPITMSTLYKLIHGQPAASFVDERYRRWAPQSWAATLPSSPPFTQDQRAVMRKRFAEYSRDFLAALRSHGTYYQKVDELRKLLPERQKSIVDLDLKIGGL